MSANLSRRPGLRANLLSKGTHFFNDQLFHALDRVFLFERKVEFLYQTRSGGGKGEKRTSKSDVRIGKGYQDKTYRLTNGFVSRIVPDLQVRMVQRLLTADPFGWVKAQHLREKIDSKRVCVGVQSRKGYAGLDGERSDVVLRLDQALPVSLHASLG